MDQFEIIVENSLEKVHEVRTKAKISRLEEMDWELVQLETFLTEFIDGGEQKRKPDIQFKKQ